MGPATEKARRLEVEPVARYCKQLTVGGTQVPPRQKVSGGELSLPSEGRPTI